MTVLEIFTGNEKNITKQSLIGYKGFVKVLSALAAFASIAPPLLLVRSICYDCARDVLR